MTGQLTPPSPEIAMPGALAAAANEALRLGAALRRLEDRARILDVTPLAGREWWELLSRKLLPQLAEAPFLVAAVVGGTNIGKSVVFNHLARERASATSPLASGTRHPTCLVPRGFTERHNLAAIFPGFTLSEWRSADAPLIADDTDRLYWKVSDSVPPQLLVLDTPDIDSDAPVNWHRADCIRHAADVLVAVLTQQKYNDAAVKQFFRRAADEAKAVLVVFNQVLLPEDEEFWPRWMETFSRETGIVPDAVYLAPNDRRAAEANRLPFHFRTWPPADAGASVPIEPPHDLAHDLTTLHLEQIKLRTLRGSLVHLLRVETGIPGYLAELRRASGDFAAAADLLAGRQLVRVDDWPAPPTALLVEQVREWWRRNREGWSRVVHETYGAVGQGLAVPFRWARNRLVGPATDLRDTYRQAEWRVMLQATEQLYDELSRLSQLGNTLLQPRLERLLAGSTRGDLIERLAAEQKRVDLDSLLADVVRAHMEQFRTERGPLYLWLRQLDRWAAAARPVTSVALFAAGVAPAGHALMPLVSTGLAQSLVVHLTGDALAGAGAVVVGESTLTGAAGLLRSAEVYFRRLQTAVTARRAEWFAQFLSEHLLAGLHDELHTAAGIGRGDELHAVEDLVATLSRLLANTPAAEV